LAQKALPSILVRSCSPFPAILDGGYWRYQNIPMTLTRDGFGRSHLRVIVSAVDRRVQWPPTGDPLRREREGGLCTVDAIYAISSP
jgi:hypothetical protein